MEAKISKLAIVSLILGAIGLFCPLLGIAALIGGIVALIRIKRLSNMLKGKWLAISGVILGIISLVLFVIILINIRAHYRTFRLPTESMSPAIKSQDKIIVDRKAYVNSNPQRGDIVVFELSINEKNKFMCKRIIGLPEEKLEIRNGRIFVNGVLTEIPGVETQVYYYNAGEFAKEGLLMEISKDHYYVLGDNSAKSQDSRYFGPIGKRDIYGKVILNYSKNPPYPKIFELLGG